MILNKLYHRNFTSSNSSHTGLGHRLHQREPPRGPVGFANHKMEYGDRGGLRNSMLSSAQVNTKGITGWLKVVKPGRCARVSLRARCSLPTKIIPENG